MAAALDYKVPSTGHEACSSSISLPTFPNHPGRGVAVDLRRWPGACKWAPRIPKGQGPARQRLDKGGGLTCEGFFA